MSYNDFEKEIVRDYPCWFEPYPSGAPREAFDVSCNSGWFPMLRQLLKDIQATGVKPRELRILQIKEKFGGLRFYFSCENTIEKEVYDQIQQLVDKAEEASYNICEDCSATEDVQTNGTPYWLRSLCPKCRNARMAEVKPEDKEDE